MNITVKEIYGTNICYWCKNHIYEESLRYFEISEYDLFTF